MKNNLMRTSVFMALTVSMCLSSCMSKWSGESSSPPTNEDAKRNQDARPPSSPMESGTSRQGRSNVATGEKGPVPVKIPPREAEKSCDIRPLSGRSLADLPTLVGSGAALKGIIQSDLKFKFITNDNVRGVQIDETLHFIYLESLQNKAASALLTALTNNVKAKESCQISVGAVNVVSVPSEPLAFRSSVDFRVRKCVGTDYPCGTTCEIRWGYQACRTDWCRATAITDIAGGSASGTTGINISVASATEVKAEASTPDYRSDVSIGDVGEALVRLGLSRADFDNIFGAAPPDLSSLLSNSKYETQIPQQAFIYKPRLIEAKWRDVTELRLPEAQRFGVMITRQAQIERTVACKWIACARSGTPDKCDL